MAAPLSEVPQESSPLFSLFSLTKVPTHWLVATVVRRFHQYFVPKIYFFGPSVWGPVKFDTSAAELLNVQLSEGEGSVASMLDIVVKMCVETAHSARCLRAIIH